MIQILIPFVLIYYFNRGHSFVKRLIFNTLPKVDHFITNEKSLEVSFEQCLTVLLLIVYSYYLTRYFSTGDTVEIPSVCYGITWLIFSTLGYRLKINLLYQIKIIYISGRDILYNLGRGCRYRSGRAGKEGVGYGN